MRNALKPGGKKRVKGQCPLRSPEAAPLVGFGATPQLLVGRPFQRKPPAKGAGSEASLPVTLRSRRSAPQAALSITCTLSRPLARPQRWSSRHSMTFPQAGISRLQARPEGFAVAPDTPSQRSPMQLDFYRNISLRICRRNHALPQWICGCLKKGAGKAKWN